MLRTLASCDPGLLVNHFVDDLVDINEKMTAQGQGYCQQQALTELQTFLGRWGSDLKYRTSATVVIRPEVYKTQPYYQEYHLILLYSVARGLLALASFLLDQRAEPDVVLSYYCAVPINHGSTLLFKDTEASKQHINIFAKSLHIKHVHDCETMLEQQMLNAHLAQAFVRIYLIALRLKRIQLAIDFLEHSGYQIDESTFRVLQHNHMHHLIKHVKPAKYADPPHITPIIQWVINKKKKQWLLNEVTFFSKTMPQVLIELILDYFNYDIADLDSDLVLLEEYSIPPTMLTSFQQMKISDTPPSPLPHVQDSSGCRIA